MLFIKDLNIFTYYFNSDANSFRLRRCSFAFFSSLKHKVDLKLSFSQSINIFSVYNSVLRWLWHGMRTEDFDSLSFIITTLNINLIFEDCYKES